MLNRRGAGRGHRFLGWQVGLFFAGAALLVGGMLAEMRSVTGVALGILVLGLMLGLLGRRLERPPPED